MSRPRPFDQFDQSRVLQGADPFAFNALDHLMPKLPPGTGRNICFGIRGEVSDATGVSTRLTGGFNPAEHQAYLRWLDGQL